MLEIAKIIDRKLQYPCIHNFTSYHRTIQDWPEPRKVKDIQSFLGFANFYRRFISEYSDIVVPLTRLTRKGTTWNFSDAA